MSEDQIQLKENSKQMPLAYSFNVETSDQLVDIMTEQGRFSFT